MRWIALLLALSVMSLVPAADADQGRCNEPCGYIVPIIDLDFPDKQLCGGGRLLFAEETPDDCEPLMANGGTFSIDGRLRWYWDAQEEPTYPLGVDPTGGGEQPITISFSGTQSNPDWIDVQVEPSEFEVSSTDLYDPQNYDIDPNSNPVAWYSYERDITVTFTRTGDPDARWLDKIDGRQGVVPVFVKARSTASGSYYRESFGVEEFRFNAFSDEAVLEAGDQSRDAGRDTPGIGPLALVGAVGAAAWAARRR